MNIYHNPKHCISLVGLQVKTGYIDMLYDENVLVL
jgi:hypothetical protein